MRNRKNVAKFFVYGLLAVCAAAMIIYTNYVKRNGVYVVASKVGTTSGGKNAATSDYEYFYEKNRYTFSKRDYGNGEVLIFLKILSGNPSQSVFVSDRVPPCLQYKNLKNQSWETLPNCE